MIIHYRDPLAKCGSGSGFNNPGGTTANNYQVKWDWFFRHLAGSI
jgi:hypothetical protein